MREDYIMNIKNYGFSFFGEIIFDLFLFPAFLGIGSLVLSEIWHKDAKWQCPKCEGARFRKNNWPNLGQKLSKNRVFWLH